VNGRLGMFFMLQLKDDDVIGTEEINQPWQAVLKARRIIIDVLNRLNRDSFPIHDGFIT